jgi:hypothetical protein
VGYAGLTETISQLTEMQKEILVELQKVLLTLNMMYVYFLSFGRLLDNGFFDPFLAASRLLSPS